MCSLKARPHADLQTLSELDLIENAGVPGLKQPWASVSERFQRNSNCHLCLIRNCHLDHCDVGRWVNLLHNLEIDPLCCHPGTLTGCMILDDDL